MPLGGVSVPLKDSYGGCINRREVLRCQTSRLLELRHAKRFELCSCVHAGLCRTFPMQLLADMKLFVGNTPMMSALLSSFFILSFNSKTLFEHPVWAMNENEGTCRGMFPRQGLKSFSLFLQCDAHHAHHHVVGECAERKRAELLLGVEWQVNELCCTAG